jgi:hypothetical protein
MAIAHQGPPAVQWNVLNIMNIGDHHSVIQIDDLFISASLAMILMECREWVTNIYAENYPLIDFDLHQLSCQLLSYQEALIFTDSTDPLSIPVGFLSNVSRPVYRVTSLSTDIIPEDIPIKKLESYTQHYTITFYWRLILRVISIYYPSHLIPYLDVPVTLLKGTGHHIDLTVQVAMSFNYGEFLGALGRLLLPLPVA